MRVKNPFIHSDVQTCDIARWLDIAHYLNVNNGLYSNNVIFIK